MKKITLLLAFMLTYSISNAQFTTSEITLASNLHVTIETQASEVTITLKGPANKWFAVGFGGQNMGATSDVFVYDGTNNFDKTGHNHSAPTNDATQDWTNITDTVNGSERTIQATRTLSTSETNDYTFMNDASNIPVIWAIGTSATLTSHANRGVASLPRTAVANINSQKQIQFAMYPNPVQTKLNIVLPSSLEHATVKVYDILGKQVIQKNLNNAFNKLDVSNINSGIYLIKIIGEDNTFGIKQFVKK